jgi:hypothetical protein
MPDEREFVSKPKAREELYVLCVDGTQASDSAAFFDHVRRAGLKVGKSKGGVAVRNLLDLVGNEPSGMLTLPGERFTDFPFSFSPDDMKRLPIRRVPVPGGGAGSVRVLLPQGQVNGDVNRYDDPALGSTQSARQHAVRKNSQLTRFLLLGPAVAPAPGESSHLDFATSGNTACDILYLSGHGSMAGTVMGESGPEPDSGHMIMFQPLDLLKPLPQRVGRRLRAPLWLVIASCYSLRKVHAEIWLRLLRGHPSPIRGILGYQTPAPLAAASSTINQQFAKHLSEGKTFVDAWRAAHGDQKNGNLAEKWTALALAGAEKDTLTTLRELKAGKGTTATSGSRLAFYRHGELGSAVEIKPPSALFEVEHWGVGARDSDSSWRKVLTSNLDFDEVSSCAARDADYVGNQSWENSRSSEHPRVLPSLANIRRWDHRFYPGHFYALQVFPPFRPAFAAGFQRGDHNGDEIQLSLIHVRPNRKKPEFTFLSVFDVLSVNGESALRDGNYWVPVQGGDGQDGWRIHLRARCPSRGSAFAPLRVVLRYREDNRGKPYLWFWFRVSILRNKVAIFTADFDNFIMTPEAGDYTPMTTSHSLPPEL